MYQFGWCGQARDERKAFLTYRAAHELGCAVATNNLAVCYSLGIGIFEDQTKAQNLWAKLLDSKSDDAKTAKLTATVGARSCVCPALCVAAVIRRSVCAELAYPSFD